MTTRRTNAHVELYARLQAFSEAGMDIGAQADALNVTKEKLRDLRFKAKRAGFTIEDAPAANQYSYPEHYWSKEDDEAEAAAVQRCACGLTLPCEDCTARRTAHDYIRSGLSVSGL